MGEVRPVSGGYGLMLVVEVDRDEECAAVQGHGYSAETQHWAPLWFRFERLGEPVGAEVIAKEREEAAARRVACNIPGCWCLGWRP